MNCLKKNIKVNKFGISDKSMKFLLQGLKSFEDIDEAFVFGSTALGNYKKGSDIDIAIFGSYLKKETSMNLSAMLNEVLPIPYYTDIIAPKFINNKELIEHISSVGITIYNK